MMVDSPPITVIVPHHNGVNLLEDCLSSLQNLDYPREGYAVFVVDDASSDYSTAFLKERFPEVRILANPVNLGFAASINRGVREAPTEWVAFLNNDTRVEPTWLRGLTEVLNPEAGIWCSASKTLDWEGRRITFQGGSLNFVGKGFEDACDVGSPEERLEDVPLLFASGCAMAVHRETFLDLGGFDEDFFGFFEDTDFGWRMNLLGYRVVLAPDSRVFHRGHASFDAEGRKRRLRLLERNALRQIFKNYGDDLLHPMLSAALLLAIKRSEILGRFGSCRMTGFSEGPPAFSKRLLGRRARPAAYADDGGLHTEACAGVFEGLDSLVRKRESVQSRRVVSDEEILRSPLFPTPFRRWHLDEPMRAALDEGHYKTAFRSVVEAFEIDRFFSASP